MFTERQVHIAGLCVNPYIKRTLGEIAEILDISESTVLAEIRAINEELPEGEGIISRKGKVFIEKPFSEETAKLLKMNGRKKHERYERDRMIVAYLCFRGGYVSLEEIAEHIYLSKTGVYKYINSDWRLKEQLETDPVKGTRLRGIDSMSEEEIRRILSRNFRWRHEDLSFLGLKMSVQDIVKAVEKIHNEHIMIFGNTVPDKVKEDMVNYLSITLIRKLSGNVLEGEAAFDESLSNYNFVLDLSKRLEKYFNVKFTDRELYLIHEETRFAEQINFPRRKDHPGVRKYQKLVNEYLMDIKRRMYIRFDDDELTDLRFAVHLYHLEKRMEQGVYTPNPDKREISGRFPWAAALVNEYLLPKLDFEVHEIERASLILYTAIYLRSGKEQMHAYFITRDVPGRISYTIRMLMSSLSKELSSIEIVPCYKFELLKDEYLSRRGILITTEPDVAVTSPKMLLVRPVMEPKEELEAQEIIKTMIRQAVDQEMQIEIRHRTVAAEECMREADTSKLILTDDDHAAIVDFIDRGESYIEVMDFEKALEYRNRPLKGIVKCSICAEETDPYQFFDEVRKLVHKRDLN
ncbi:MAG: hypothetical protein K6F39_02475 [Lachnospiraceae bacterium]|nr:hypothetical protein [Lachnospiraceae bacterium]